MRGRFDLPQISRRNLRPFENARAYPRIQPRHRLNAGEVGGCDERSLLGRLKVEQVFIHNERAAVDGAAERAKLVLD